MSDSDSTGLSFEEWDQLRAVNQTSAEVATSADDWDAMDTIPPGKEAMFLSHEGGEVAMCADLIRKM